MTNPVSAAATGLPVATTRRRALASFAGFGASLSLPKVAKAASLTVGHPDAVLIAHASMVEEMAVRAYAAIEHSCDLENKIERLMPIASRPDRPAALHTSESSFEDLAEGGFIMRSTRLPIDPVAARTVREQQETLDIWEAERDALSDSLGVEAAEDLQSDLYAALEEVVRDLTSMTPTTMAGLVAKTRAAASLDPHGDNSFNPWEDELRSAVISDLMAIGGMA